MVKLSLKNIQYENFDLELEDESGNKEKHTFKIRYSNLDIWEGLAKLNDLKDKKTEDQIRYYKDIYDLIVIQSTLKKEAFFKLNLDILVLIMTEMIKVSTSNTTKLTEEKKSA